MNDASRLQTLRKDEGKKEKVNTSILKSIIKILIKKKTRNKDCENSNNYFSSHMTGK